MTVATQTQVFSEMEWFELTRELSLSPRQTQVIQQLFAGRSDKQIAQALRVSVPTVRTHLSRLFARFGVEDRCELILRVFAHFRQRCVATNHPHIR